MESPTMKTVMELDIGGIISHLGAAYLTEDHQEEFVSDAAVEAAILLSEDPTDLLAPCSHAARISLAAVTPSRTVRCHIEGIEDARLICRMERQAV